MLQFCILEIKELNGSPSVNHDTRLQIIPTLIVPSNVVTITHLLSESVVIPDIDLSLPFAIPELNRLAVSGGQGPSLKVFRLMPDCRFHMSI